MGNNKKKFSFYNDYLTVNFGGNGSGSRRSTGRNRPNDDVDHTWCEDCSGTGKCVHCKDGQFPLRKGGTATCGKCHSSLQCHACRGTRIDGKKCNTPTYEETVEANKRAAEKPMWSKYTSSDDHGTGKPQTNFFTGYVGEHDQRKKVHIVINYKGDVVFVRDMDGTVLYDRRAGIGHLPPDLDWGR